MLFTLLTLAVLGVIAAVATGRIAGGLEEPSTSLPPRGLPEGPVTAESLEVVRFSPALRGYRMEEVDAVLDRLGGEIVSRDRQILQLSQELRLTEREDVQRAVRGTASPDGVCPETGSLPIAGAAPGSAPVGGAHGVNGNQESDPPAQAHPAPSYVEQDFAVPSYAAPEYAGQDRSAGRDYPAGRDQAVEAAHPDEPDRREE